MVLSLEKRVSDVEEELEDTKRSLEDASHKNKSAAVVKTLQKDVEMLLKELDRERNANLELVGFVEAAQEETARTTERLLVAEKHIRSLKKSGGKLPSSQSASDLHTTPEQLQDRITNLKNARDRLIEALDAQAADTERLSIENSSLVEALSLKKRESSQWQSQTQKTISQCNYLKDMLEESAQWSASGNDNISTTGKHAEIEEKCRALEQQLLQEQANSAALQTQVFGLCAELTRLATVSTGVHHAVLPALCEVEGRLSMMIVK